MSTRQLLTPKTAARFLELETRLETVDGVAETVLSDILDQIMEGDAGLILEAWSFEDPNKAAARIRRLAARWRKEDAVTTSADGKEGQES